MYKITIGLSLVIVSSLAAATPLSDPTRPSGYHGLVHGPIGMEDISDIRTFKLSSIIYSDARKIAVINNKPWKMGDKIGGYTVENIWADKVNLKGPERSLVLSLNPERVKKLRRKDG